MQTLSQQWSKTVSTKIKAGWFVLFHGWLVSVYSQVHVEGGESGSCLDWTCNLSVTKLSSRPTCLNYMILYVYNVNLCKTSHIIIKLSSPSAYVLLNGGIERKQGAGCYTVPKPHQSPPVWMRKAESGNHPLFTPLCPLLRNQREGREHTSRVHTHLPFLLEGLTSVRHQPGHFDHCWGDESQPSY